MIERNKIKTILELFIAWNGETEVIDIANLDSAVDFIIDSMQEEPVAPKVLEDMLNAKTAAESLGIPQEEHDRIVDELIYGKEPELVDVDDLPNKEEEPVSEKKCMFTKDSYTDEDRKVLCEGCEEKCEHNKKEEPVNDECIYNRTLEERQRSCKFCSAACQVRIKEPVSENFEKALAREWHDYNDRGAATVDALEDNTQELAFAKGFYRGAKWQKEEMMAKAIDAQCFGFQGDALFSFRLPADNYLIGSKVKLIIVKDD